MTEEVKSPGMCQACHYETDDLTRVRSANHGDERYTKDGWFNWYCDLCLNTRASTAHKYHKKEEAVLGHISRMTHKILDRMEALLD